MLQLRSSFITMILPRGSVSKPQARLRANAEAGRCHQKETSEARLGLHYAVRLRNMTTVAKYSFTTASLLGLQTPGMMRLKLSPLVHSIRVLLNREQSGRPRPAPLLSTMLQPPPRWLASCKVSSASFAIFGKNFCSSFHPSAASEHPQTSIISYS